MPIIRTVFRPWEDAEVSETEAASMAAMGLLSLTGSVEPGPPAEPETAAPEAAADEPPAPKTGRSTKNTTPAAAEEVKTDGSSEEGGTQVQEG